MILLILLTASGVTGCMERLFFVPIGVPPAPPQGVEEVWFESSDGVRLHGWFMPAGWPLKGAEPPGVRHPTILSVHGNAGNVADHLGFFEAVPRAGFNILLFDYRSYGKSERGRLRRNSVVKDVEGALDYLLTRPDVDGQRVGLWAQSLGATFGLDVMRRRSEIRSAVVTSAFTSWQEIAATVVVGESPGGMWRWLAARLVPVGMDPVDLITQVGGRPVMLVHGTEDEIVPFSHSQRLLTAAGPGANVSLRPVVGAHHNDIADFDPTLSGDIAAFFSSTLRAVQTTGQ